MCHEEQDRLRRLRIRGAPRLVGWLASFGEPQRFLNKCQGVEDFEFPGTVSLLECAPHRPDVVHAHNLHGEYFDLRYLRWLSREVPVALTLHDAWLLSGHCAHSFDCERWKIGCGHCPDLTIYPAVHRDATAYNWRRKQEIYAKSRFYVATPSKWLMRKVEESMLAPAILEARVIPNGVELAVFHPADRKAIREALGIPQDARVLLFTANHIRRNIWKDYQTMRAAVALVADRLGGRSLLFVALGEEAPAERIGRTEVRFVAYQEAPKVVATYYQAADVYMHAARAEAWGLTITEALACGTPVVATAVGGIPEQVKGLEHRAESACYPIYGPAQATGMLVRSGDAEGMATAIELLLRNDPLRLQMAQNAATDASQRFDLNRQADEYLAWYREISERWIVERSTFQPLKLQRGSYAVSSPE
jgi:glycosyltransferase involved in cell wall biosynthesis